MLTIQFGAGDREDFSVGLTLMIFVTHCKILPLRSESKVVIVFQYVIIGLTTLVTWSASKNMSLSARTIQ